MNSEETILDLVRSAKDNYVSGVTRTGKYVDFNLYEHIEKIHAYLNGKHLSGEVDSLGREKPFFDIITAAVNIYYRATDIDRKNIRIKADKAKNILLAFIATVHLENFLKREDFGTFLNKWGRVMAGYGSVISKFVEKDGRLIPSVIPWNRIICDSVDFYNNPKIEILHLTPAQLRDNPVYDQDVVESLINSVSTRKLLDGTPIDNKKDFIEIFEVHGNLSVEYLGEKPGKTTKYTQQIHVVSFVNGEKEGTYEDFTLYKGREAKDPYRKDDLIEEEGRVISKGAVEMLFDAQWMVNHSVKLSKDILDVASKILFQTDDTNFVNQNILTSVETGDILTHSPNQPLQAVPNNSHDLGSLQNFGGLWQNQAKEIANTPDAISGNTMPSGTAYRQVAILNQESHSLFQLMTENKALAIERMLREVIIPFLKKKMDTADEISAVLSDRDIAKIDPIFVKAKASGIHNDIIKKQILEDGAIADVPDLDEIQNGIRDGLKMQGNQRFFTPSDVSDKTWKELLKDFEWEVEVEVSGEYKDKDAGLATLTTVLQTVAANPSILQNPTTRMVFNRILETAGGISPVELPAIEQGPQQQQPVPSDVKMGGVVNNAQPIGGT